MNKNITSERLPTMSVVPLEEFSQAVDAKRAAGEHPSVAFVDALRDFERKKLDLAAGYPFAMVKYLSKEGARTLELVFKSRGENEPKVSFKFDGATDAPLRMDDGLVFDFPVEQPTAITGPTASVVLMLGSDASGKKLRTAVAVLDFKEFWDMSKSAQSRRTGTTKFNLRKAPLFTVTQIASAAKFGLPLAYLNLDATLKWGDNDQLTLIVKRASVKLDWIAAPEVTTDSVFTDAPHYEARPIRALDIEHSASSGTAHRPRHGHAHRASTASAARKESFDRTKLSSLVEQFASQGIHIKAMGMASHSHKTELVFSGQSERQPEKLRHLGDVTQILFAASVVHHVAERSGSSDTAELKRALSNRTLLSTMLRESGAQTIVTALEEVYGGADNLPTLAELLGNVSGLPDTLVETPALIEKILALRGQPTIGAYDEATKIFADALSAVTLLSSPGDRAYLESPLGYAILGMALPHGDVEPVIRAFLERVLNITEDQWTLGRSKSGQKYGPLYLGYDGLSMNLEAIVAFAQHPSWHSTREEVEYKQGEFADSGHWLSLLHRDGARFSANEEASFGYGNLMSLLSSKSDEDSGILKLVSADRNIVLLILPQAKASGVVFYRKEGKGKKREHGNRARLTPQAITKMVTHALSKMLLASTIGEESTQMSRFRPERLPPIAQSADSASAANEIRHMRDTPLSRDELAEFQSAAITNWTAAFQTEKRGLKLTIRVAGDRSQPVLELKRRGIVYPFEMFYDKKAGEWFVIDPVTHLRGGLVSLTTITTKDYVAGTGADASHKGEMLRMVGFRGHLFGPPTKIKLINTLMDPNGDEARRLTYQHEQERAAAKKESVALRRAAMSSINRRRNDDESSDSESSGAESDEASGSDTSESSDSASSDNDNKLAPRRRHRRRSHKHKHDGTKPKKAGLLEAIKHGFSKRGQRLREVGPATYNLGDWHVSPSRAAAIGSVFAFPAEKTPYPTGIYVDLLGSAHVGMVPKYAPEEKQ